MSRKEPLWGAQSFHHTGSAHKETRTVVVITRMVLETGWLYVGILIVTCYSLENVTITAEFSMIISAMHT